MLNSPGYKDFCQSMGSALCGGNGLDSGSASKNKDNVDALLSHSITKTTSANAKL